MEIYFDNSATTRALDGVKDLVVKLMTEDYANPSSRHRKGMEAEQYVKEAAMRIAKTLKVKEKEIILPPGVRSPTIWLSSVRLLQVRELENTLSALGLNTPRCISRWLF